MNDPTKHGGTRLESTAPEPITQQAFPYIPPMSKSPGYRLSAATGLHRGDRAYQQDQVTFIAHDRVPGCAMAVVADGMGGKSGGRKAADQVIMVARQLFERFAPSTDNSADLLRQLVVESHQMIRLTAITAEAEPHSTIAAFLISPERQGYMVHAVDSRIYLFRGAEMALRTLDHSLVQRMVDEGKLSEEDATNHPQSNLLTGCLGTQQDPPLAVRELGQLEIGDTLMACSDGLWHYFTQAELGAIVHSLPPRDASEMLVSKARQRARGGGDNISVVIARIDSLAKATSAMPLGTEPMPFRS